MGRRLAGRAPFCCQSLFSFPFVFRFFFLLLCFVFNQNENQFQMKKTCSDIQASETLRSFLRNAENWIVCPGCLIEQISVIDEKSLTHMLYWTREGRNLHSHVSLDRPFPPNQSLLIFFFSIFPLIVQRFLCLREIHPATLRCCLCMTRFCPPSAFIIPFTFPSTRQFLRLCAMRSSVLPFSHPPPQVLGLQRRGRPGPGSAPDGDGRRGAAPGRHGAGRHQPARHDRQGKTCRWRLAFISLSPPLGWVIDGSGN